ncbi:copper amine oxidase N-terminal domain-containing protein [Paenibacillus sp. Cedars]|uniref:copper amine oxidase N-terminal domain-containing protein n=1 Tax=Paenibacillus sp. Cedars TaxID=1980674 RepID=UPI001163E2DF|nr:copper amine oxidase N-terminal domain-containing protein [Paenibacillus sp. Cedars]AWP29784.1 copper amine oxidase [Paenibacillus sp. Cedars]
MKKKISLLAIAFLFLFASAAQAAPAKNQGKIRVYLDNQEIKFQAAPIMKNGVTFVQFRPLFQALDYKVNWNSANKQVTGTYLDQKLQMTIGQKTAYVNGVKTSLQIAPFTDAGNTLVPLRFVAEATGLPVKWDAKARTIKIDREGAIDKATDEVKKLYHALEEAGNAKKLDAAMALFHSKSPVLAKTKEGYQNQFKYDLHVSSDVWEVTVAGTSIHAFTSVTLERSSGPFTWDVTLHYENLLKKDASGAWKIYDLNQYDTEYLAGDNLLDANPKVPEAELKAIRESIDTQYKGFNEENGPLLMSVIHPDSAFYEMFQNSIAEGIFDEVNFNLTAEVVRPVFFQGEETVVYIEETDDADGDIINTTSLYWLKKANGQWLIYDVLELE